MTETMWTRREAILAAGAAGLVPLELIGAERDAMLTRPIPASGEALPVVGLGTYDVFDIAGSDGDLARRREIMDLLVDAGGSVLDTSPMYKRSEKVIGELIDQRDDRDHYFIATKVWTDGRERGLAQMQQSGALMRADTIDLMQVHNLRDTEIHMASIRALQAEGRIRYNGLTHYTAGAHEALEAEMQRYRPDFIQINYSLGEREAGERLLPLAQDLGVAVIVNRPYQAGRLFGAVAGKDLPDWAREFAASWGQFFLKFIIGHPAVTCAIPATSKPHHMADNVQAGFGRLPDAKMRQRMVRLVEDL